MGCPGLSRHRAVQTAATHPDHAATHQPREAGLLHPVDGPGAPKLRGTAVDHFGGFLHREWRENDYLWGRLDTAEIIMGMIGHPGRNKHSDAAFHAILDAEEKNLTATRELISSLRHQQRARDESTS